MVLTGKLRGQEFTEEFLVGQMADEAILGMLFRKKNTCTLACSEGVLLYQGAELLCTDRLGNLLTTKVQVARTITIPAATEVQLVAKLTDHPSGPTGIVEHLVWGDSGLAVSANLRTPTSGGRHTAVT